MKKIIYIMFFIISILSFGQKGPNPFMEEESVSAVPKDEKVQVSLADDNVFPGDPADPMPINDYIPLLIITAMGLIIFNQKRYRQSS